MSGGRLFQSRLLAAVKARLLYTNTVTGTLAVDGLGVT